MPEPSKPHSCVIVGAGMAGLTAAGVLQAAGWDVLLLDKGRAVGGRMATRRIGTARFDHGAQFFTVRDPRFREAVDRWVEAGRATTWFEDQGHQRYRGVGGMNALAKHLAELLQIRTETLVKAVKLVGATWSVETETGETFHAGALLLTAPAPQTLALLSQVADRLPEHFVAALQSIDFDPCFALMALLEKPSRIPAPGYVRPGHGPVAWLADNTQKGVSEGSSAVTIHASPEASRTLFDAPPEDVARVLLDAAEPFLGSPVLDWQLQRWKFSQPVKVCSESCLSTESPAPLAVAGDAFGGPRVEGAFLSGLAAAAALQSK